MDGWRDKRSVKRRIFLACGISELVTCTWVTGALDEGRAVDYEDVLLVYGKRISMPIPHVETTLRLGFDLGKFSHVEDVTDWSENVSNALFDRREAPRHERAIEWLTNADEIYLHTIWNTFERHILELAPRASLVLYDNGLDSHLERAIVDVVDDPASLVIRSHDLSRVSRFVYTIGDYVPIPEFANPGRTIVPSAAGLNDHYRHVASTLHVSASPESRDNNPVVLSIGTSFYRMKKFDARVEETVYNEFHRDAAKNGYQVLWKPHPRAVLQFETNDAHWQPFDQSIPIELLPSLSDVSFSGSMSSTALITLKKVYGIPYILLGRHLTTKLNLKWLAILQQHSDSSLLMAE
jgi:hypothetical protein